MSLQYEAAECALAEARAECERQRERAEKWQAAAEGERERAAQACEREAKAFLSPEYATGQPISSISERFACKCCAKALRALPAPTIEPPDGKCAAHLALNTPSVTDTEKANG